MKRAATYTLLAMMFATPVVAQEVYVGGAVDYGYPHSGDTYTAGTFLAGVIFDLGPVGLGIEADVGESADHETSRVRGLLTYDFGRFTAIASAGSVQYKANGTVTDGEAYGLGAQMPLAEQVDGRFEFIRDFVGGDFGTNVTTTRLSVMYKF